VLERGVAILDREGDDRSYPTKTISVLIENDNRVFRIERGVVVKYVYALSDSEFELVDVGSRK
jgi:hypothetical protein